MLTLASAQLERDKIKAIKAKKEFETKFNDTVSKKDIAHVKKIIKQTVLIELKKIQTSFQRELFNETGEAKTHLIMSDIAHNWLNETGTAVQQNLTNQEIGNLFKKAIKPKAMLTVSQWAENNRVIASGTNMPGPWRNENAPHIVDIMDDLSEHSPVRQVTFKKSSGVGGSEVLWNWIGYVIHHVQTKDLMLVVPSLELRDREFNPKFKKTVLETPALTPLISFKTRDSAANKEYVEFGQNSRLIKTGANSPNSLRATHVPYVAGDEVSAFPWDSGGEGDPVTLIENRQKTFTRYKRLYISSPTNANHCRITSEFEKSDQRYRHVPCPHCQKRQTLRFKRFHWEYTAESKLQKGLRKIVKTAWFECKHCKQKIEEYQKNDMLQKGIWIPNKPHIKDHHGYHINAFYIKFGLGKTWTEIAQEWVDAQHDDSKLKAVVNTYLGEVWEEKGETIEANTLLSRLENFKLAFGKNPPKTLRVAGVDIQKDRFEATIVDFEESEEAWVVKHLIIPAETAHAEEWQKLHDELKEHNVIVAAIDSGYNTSLVYEFCLKNKWAIPIKGVPGMSRPLIEDKEKRAKRLRTRRKKKVIQPEPLGVDQGKTLIFARLKLPSGITHDIDQETGEIISTHRTPTAGYIHFDNDASFDDEYFAQLVAEKLVTKKRAGREIQEWVAQRARNEALDCMVYALACYRLVNDIPSLRLLMNQPNSQSSNQDADSQPLKKRRRRGR